MKDNGSIENNLEIFPSGRKEDPMLTVVDNLPNHLQLLTVKNPWIATSEWEVMRVANDEPLKRPANNGILIESFVEDRQYPSPEPRPPVAHCKNHILPQHIEGSLKSTHFHSKSKSNN